MKYLSDRIKAKNKKEIHQKDIPLKNSYSVIDKD
jgi:hypothetical protein